jgi:hypothetical protein
VTDSFEQRISAAEDELRAARRARDTFYPGSPEWESAQGKVEEWESALRELRREARG